MTVSTVVKIGSDSVDLGSPCDVVAALRKVELAIVAGQKRETVRFGDDQVTFTAANLDRLAALIRTYEDKCRLASGGGRTRYAMAPRFVR
jgi:hypothetical protein